MSTPEDITALEREVARLKYRKMLARGKGEISAINRSIKKAQAALDAAKANRK